MPLHCLAQNLELTRLMRTHQYLHVDMACLHCKYGVPVPCWQYPVLQAPTDLPYIQAAWAEHSKLTASAAAVALATASDAGNLAMSDLLGGYELFSGEAVDVQHANVIPQQHLLHGK
jgi:hypothetical protein